MDPIPDVHRRRIDNNCNYIEYRAPVLGKAKYVPPSPTTSGYSESGSEADNHDSGRVSEMEGSPKIHPRRPDTIALNVGLFHPTEKAPVTTSPELQTATMKSSGQRAPSRDVVTLSARDFRTLVDCLRDARMRLNRMECRVESLVKALQMQRDESKGAVLKLNETLLALGSDIGTRQVQNGWSHACSNRGDRILEVSASSNNNNLGPAPECARMQSYEGSQASRSLPRKSFRESDHQTATFPRFSREKCNKSGDKSYNSEHVGGDVTKGDAIASMTYPRRPVYAVVKKKNPTEIDEADSVLPENGMALQNGPSLEDLEELLQESCISPKDDESFSPSASLTRVSRFSEADSLMSALEDSIVLSEEQPHVVEQLTDGFETLTVETYDNRSTDGSDDSLELPHERGVSREKGEDVFSLVQHRKNCDSGVATSRVADEPDGSEGWNVAQRGRSETFFDSRAPQIGPEKAGNVQDSSAGSASLKSTSCAANGRKVAKNKVESRESKRENVLVSNYRKLFNRKGKNKRAESETSSFMFVVSPLYEAESVDERGQKQKLLKRGHSADSVLSDKRSDSSLTFNVSSSRECSLSLDASQGDTDSPVEVNSKNRSNSCRSLTSTRRSRLQSEGLLQREAEFVRESRDNSNTDERRPQDEDMRANFVKLAKRAFRNSPKILRKNRTPPGARTAELKPKLQNGHAVSGSEADPSPSSATASAILKATAPERKPWRTDDEAFGDGVFISSRVILDRLQREQADRARFENDRPVAPDVPPPKPSRPGYPRGGHGSPRSSVSQHSNGGVPGYPRGMPAVPPKQKIMTPEELTIHEAQEKLRVKQMEEAMLQQTLDQQQKQAAENARWLQQEEQMLSPDTSTGADESASRRVRGSSGSVSDTQGGSMEVPPPPSVAPSKPPRRSSRPKEEAAGPRQTKLEEVKTAPTMQLNRDNDDVYKNTMEVVKAVLGMNNMTMAAKPDELFVSVKSVGATLKLLCASIDKVMPDLPEDFHREIDMAQRTTNKDLSQVINQLKLVQRFAATTQVVEYKKCLMAANQVLAIDAKNLLDVVDRARIRKIQNAQDQARAEEDDIRKGSAPEASASGYEPEELYPDGDFL